MFDFEKFDVYKKSKAFTKDISDFIQKLPPKYSKIADQLSRASLSIPLNIAEGAGRYSKADKRNFYIIARGSVFECVALKDILFDKQLIDEEKKNKWYSQLEELSKMISGLINSQK